jgi:hypothetical protein
MFRHAFEQAQSVMLENERTYNTPRRLSFTIEAPPGGTSGG